MAKLKLDEDGHVVVEDGRPVYVHEDGKEETYDLPKLLATARSTRDERDTARKEAEEMRKKLSSYEDFDMDKAREALKIVEDLDSQKLIDAGKVDEVVSERLKAATKEWQSEREDLQNQMSERDAQLRKLQISDRFSRSKFIQEKLLIPADIAERYWGDNFKVEGDSVVAYVDGQKVYRRGDPDTLADFDEALEHMVDAYPRKDDILRGTGNAGSGATPPGRGDTKIQSGKWDPDDPAAMAARVRQENSLAGAS